MIGASKKLLQATAGNAGGAALDITDVFSTYLYTGNGSTQTITNGIDLSGEGGLVWIKSRTTSDYGGHYLRTFSPSSGKLDSSWDGPQNNFHGSMSTLSNGFQISGGTNTVTQSGIPHASWTFRKAPKFFDVVTYSGDGVNGRNVTHSLNSTIGTVILKRTDGVKNWFVWHRSAGITTNAQALYLNATSAVQNTGNNAWGPSGGSPSMTTTTFSVGDDLNVNGATYVAYLFAHNDGDGEFGPNGDQDIIKCGSYTGNSSGVEIDLGFEPQWFMCKKVNGGSDWQIFDTMRGMHFATATQSVRLSPNTSGAETSQLIIGPSPTGVSIPDASDSVNINGGTYIYIAIRRGPLVAAEDKEDLFYTQVWSPNGANPQSVTVAGNKNFIPDFLLVKPRTTANNWLASSRLTGGEYLNTNTNAAATSTTIDWGVKTHYGYLELGSPFNISSYGQNTSYVWSRAPGYFDVVTYKAQGTSFNINHNLGVVPELMIFKNRESATFNWLVYHKPTNTHCRLNTSDASFTTYGWSASLSDTVLPIPSHSGTADSINSYNYNNHIAYLFASLDGISKVSSYTGNGSSQTIDCGFTTGARFILIKRTDSSGDWYVWDHRFGITSGDESHFSLNTNAIQSTADDSVDPNSSGFIVNQVSATNINVSSATYIFYAIA